MKPPRSWPKMRSSQSSAKTQKRRKRSREKSSRGNKQKQRARTKKKAGQRWSRREHICNTARNADTDDDEQAGKPKSKESMELDKDKTSEIQLKEIRFKDVDSSLESSNTNDKTLKAYCAAYNKFTKQIKKLLIGNPRGCRRRNRKV